MALTTVLHRFDEIGAAIPLGAASGVGLIARIGVKE